MCTADLKTVLYLICFPHGFLIVRSKVIARRTANTKMTTATIDTDTAMIVGLLDSSVGSACDGG